MAQFFTRKKGEMLKGKPLDKDFYGIGLMAAASRNPGRAFGHDLV